MPAAATRERVPFAVLVKDLWVARMCAQHVSVIANDEYFKKLKAPRTFSTTSKPTADQVLGCEAEELQGELGDVSKFGCCALMHVM